jgi:hypothetical protein
MEGSALLFKIPTLKARHQMTCFFSIAALLLSGCSAIRVRHSDRIAASNASDTTGAYIDPSATLKLGAFEPAGSDRWGRYVTGVTFYVYEYGDKKPFKVGQSSSDGPLIIEGLIAKRYEIAFEGTGFAPISKVVRLQPETITHVDFDLIRAQQDQTSSDGLGRVLVGTLSVIGVVAVWMLVNGFLFVIVHRHH